jgi:hypothetical protein
MVSRPRLFLPLPAALIVSAWLAPGWWDETPCARYLNHITPRARIKRL